VAEAFLVSSPTHYLILFAALMKKLVVAQTFSSILSSECEGDSVHPAPSEWREVAVAQNT